MLWHILSFLVTLVTVLVLIACGHILVIGASVKGPLRWQFWSLGLGIGAGFSILLAFDLIVGTGTVNQEAPWTVLRRLPFRACVCLGLWGYLGAFRRLGIVETARAKRRHHA